MCVIIVIPKSETITREELRDAWRVNPDGAGYAVQKGDRVKFRRGYMNFKEYAAAVLPLADSNKRGALMLHLRISTGAGITAKGTHPYKAGNVLKLSGKTTAPVVAMNGVIYGQTLHQKSGNRLNDTASYIVDHADAFQVLNADILDIIASDTGAKWCAITPDAVHLAGQWSEHGGRYYSNQNHRNQWNAWNWYNTAPVEKAPAFKVSDLVRHKTARRDLKKDKSLRWYVEDFIAEVCSAQSCKTCADCITDAKTGDQLEDIINENYARQWYNLENF